MSENANLPQSWTSFRILTQIFVAFGQGSGHVMVSDEAISAAVADYLPRIEQAGGWMGRAPNVLGTARFIGQAAAQRAIRAGRAIVIAEDYQAARARVHEMSAEASELFGECPWLT
jgi:hypothetical protein